MREVYREDDPILRKKSKPVVEVTDKIRVLLDDMLETMRSSEGVGLAAPQVGVLRRIAVVEHEDKMYELINPEVLSFSGQQRKAEACLSVPGRRGFVTRANNITVRFMTREGETITVDEDDVMAVAILHEIDHLDGVLYTDKVERYLAEGEDEDAEF